MLLEGRGGERRGGIRARVLGYGEVYCWIGGGGEGGYLPVELGRGAHSYTHAKTACCVGGAVQYGCAHPTLGWGGGGEEGGQVNQASPTPRGDSMWVGGEGEDRGRAWLAHPTRRQHEGGWEGGGGGGGKDPVRWKGSF